MDGLIRARWMDFFQLTASAMAMDTPELDTPGQLL